MKRPLLVACVGAVCWAGGLLGFLGGNQFWPFLSATLVNLGCFFMGHLVCTYAERNALFPWIFLLNSLVRMTTILLFLMVVYFFAKIPFVATTLWTLFFYFCFLFLEVALQWTSFTKDDRERKHV